MLKDFFSNIRNKILLLPKNKKEEAMRLIFPALKTWEKIDGDYLEFGIYKGKSFIEAYKYAEKYGAKNMRFYAFDSFEGLPPVKGKDASYNHFFEGQYSFSKENFIKILRKNNIDLKRVEIVRGFFGNLLTGDLKNSLAIKRAAIVWIDCDIYESTVPVLEFITDFISTGTVIVFDDWFSFGADPYAGEMRAAREWLERNKNIKLEYYRDFGTSGRIFIVQKFDNKND